MLKRIVLVLVLVAVSVVGVAPWVLYGLGLHGVDGRPQLPAKVATLTEQESAWHRVRGTGTPNVTKLNPYTYFAEPGPRRAIGCGEQSEPQRSVCRAATLGFACGSSPTYGPGIASQPTNTSCFVPAYGLRH
jgi:hypothetical protein